MADVLLTHFLKGYLEGRHRERQEQEEQRRLEQQQSVVLAQFLEAVKQREREDLFRAFQMEMSKRQMELSERQQAFMERHYTIMQEIQKADLQLRQEESADRRMMLGLQIQGYLLNLLGDTVQMFGDPKRSIEFLQKNPNPTISEWAKGLNPNDVRLLSKLKFYSIVQPIVSNWRDITLPSKGLVADIIKSKGLEGIYTEDELMSLFAVQTQSNLAEHRLRERIMEKEAELQKSVLGYRYSWELRLSAMKQAQENAKMAEVEALRTKTLFDVVNDVTPIHLALTGDVVGDPEKMKKAFLEIQERGEKIMMELGVDKRAATFLTVSGLYTLIATKPNVHANVTHLFNEYSSNEAVRRSWYKGAEVLASKKLGRPANEKDVFNFVVDYVKGITGSEAIAKQAWKFIAPKDKQ